MERLTWIVDPLIVVASTLLIAIVVCHLVGIRSRAMLTRQRIFAIRDALWDVAREVNGFKDPDYLRARRLLNDAVHAVDWLSVPVILAVLMTSPREACDALPRMTVATADPRLKEAIERACRELLGICFRHAMLRPSSWTVVVLWVCFVGASNSWSSVRSWLQDWLGRVGLHTLAVLDRRAGAEARRGPRAAVGA